MSLYDGWDPPRPGWVCAECRFDYDAASPGGVGERLAGLVEEYQVRLRADADLLRARPDPSTWSALEYACHVRDCLALYDWRIRKVLSEERPHLPQMGRDAVVIERAYNQANPTAVAAEMAKNRDGLAALLGQVRDADWRRVGIRENTELSVAWMAINTLHEAQHHLMDVDRVLDRQAANGTSGC